ncbi:hypothetical protein F5X99DRAFT_387807 [Biscogniauxia marginata]|nr:hypothetical protein F5X99DRAFT_387807 [Biscogniauxia marginata]
MSACVAISYLSMYLNVLIHTQSHALSVSSPPVQIVTRCSSSAAEARQKYVYFFLITHLYLAHPSETGEDLGLERLYGPFAEGVEHSEVWEFGSGLLVQDVVHKNVVISDDDVGLKAYPATYGCSLVLHEGVGQSEIKGSATWQ